MCDLTEGEELSVNYMDGDFLLKPAPERRAELKARREFLCHCPRCSALGDDTRRFPCCSCVVRAGVAAKATKAKPGDSKQQHGVCGGYHLAIIQQSPQPQPAGDRSEAHHNGSSCNSGRGMGCSDGDPRLTECSECGRRAPTAWVDKMLREESDTTKEVARLKAIVVAAPGALPANWLNLVRSLRPPHPHHRLAHAIGLLHWAPENACGEPSAASEALKSVIACLEAIFGPHRSCMLNASNHHLLGMVMLGMPIGGYLPAHPPPTAAQDRGNARAACDALRRAAREYRVASGFRPAAGMRVYLSTRIEKDLLDAQMRLVPEDATALVSLKACSFCGSTRAEADRGDSGCGGKGTSGVVPAAMPKCGRCGQAAYCCREHQAIQWPLHKKSCRPRAAAPVAAAAAAVQLED